MRRIFVFRPHVSIIWVTKFALEKHEEGIFHLENAYRIYYLNNLAIVAIEYILTLAYLIKSISLKRFSSKDHQVKESIIG